MNLQLVGVAGLGLLGRGIVACLLAHGFQVVAFDRSPAERVTAPAAIAQAIQELVEHGGCDPSLADTWKQNYTEASTVDELAPCSFIIESITESSEAKAALYDQLESVLSAATPIASNTSALPISLLQAGRREPSRFLGMHWAEPAHATRFLELIRGEQTADEPMQAATRLAHRLGKEPCVVQQDIPGFIANRLGYALYREACHLLTLGVADAENIDRSFRNSVGLWASVCGPFRWMDLTGGPALYGRAMAGVLPTLSNATEPPEPLQTMMQSGAAGIRDGHGFFEYTPEDAKRWEDIYRRQVWRVRAAVDESLPLATVEE